MSATLFFRVFLDFFLSLRVWESETLGGGGGGQGAEENAGDDQEGSFQDRSPSSREWMDRAEAAHAIGLSLWQKERKDFEIEVQNAFDDDQAKRQISVRPDL